jgi:hypothetical protein
MKEDSFYTMLVEGNNALIRAHVRCYIAMRKVPTDVYKRDSPYMYIYVTY